MDFVTSSSTGMKEQERRFVELYEKEVDAIFRYVFLRVADKEEAKDIVQDSFTRFWQSLNSGSKIENSRAFLFSITRNRVIDWYRKKKSISLESTFEDEEGEFFEIADPDAHKQIEVSSESSLVLKAINELASQYREVVYLRFIEDLSPKDIAEILGTTPNAISIRINRGIEELRKILKIDIRSNQNE